MAEPPSSSIESEKEFEISESISSDESAESVAASAPTYSEPESEELIQHNLEIAETVTDGGVSASPDLFTSFVIITIVLGGLTVYYLWKSLKKSRLK